MDMTQGAELRDPLRLCRCVVCDYQLEGLPLEGVCPECGQAYDQKTVVLWGWSGGAKTDLGTGRLAPAMFFLIWRLLMLGVPLLALICVGPHGLILLVPVVLSAIAALLHRMNRRESGGVQVWLSEEGYLQRANAAPQSWAVRLDVLRWWVWGGSLGLFWVLTGCFVGVEAIPVPAGISLIVWYAFRDHRPQRKPVPWRQATLVHLARTTEQICVLEIWAGADREHSRPIVDAEICCPLEQGAALHERLAQWGPVEAGQPQ